MTTRGTERLHLALNISDATPAPDRLEGGSTMKLIKRPASLKATARALNNAHAAVGSHQAAALEHAITCGALLHYAKSQVKHGEWVNWLSENFSGSRSTSEQYQLVARAYAENPTHFEGVETIANSLRVARELPKLTDLPPELPGLMELPKQVQRVMPEQSAEAQEEIAEVVVENQRRAEELEREREREAERRSREIDRETESMIHPNTPAGNAARKVEGLLAKWISVDEVEGAAFGAKARQLVRGYNLEIVVIGTSDHA